MFNENFIIAFSSIIFFSLIFKPLRKVVFNTLDGKKASIVEELNEATKIKDEAQKMLKIIEEQYIDVKQNAQNIIAKAEAEAQVMLNEAKNQAENITKKRLQLAMQRIAQQEEKIIRDIKEETINLALTSVEQMLIKELNNESKHNLIEDSIGLLKKVIH